MKLNIHSIGLILLFSLFPLIVFLGKYSLSVLITSAVWVIIALISNWKRCKQFELVNNNNIKLAKEIEASDSIRKKLLLEYQTLKDENKNLTEAIEIHIAGFKIIKEEMKNYLNAQAVSDPNDITGRPFVFNVPQMDATQKLGSIVHNKMIRLDDEQKQED